MGSVEKLLAALDRLEGKLHNKEAVIAYDILAQEGGAKLYARLDAISNWANGADGPPPQGAKELYGKQKGEVDQLSRELEEFVRDDLSEHNREASKLSFPVIYPGG